MTIPSLLRQSGDVDLSDCPKTCQAVAHAALCPLRGGAKGGAGRVSCTWFLPLPLDPFVVGVDVAIPVSGGQGLAYGLCPLEAGEHADLHHEDQEGGGRGER